MPVRQHARAVAQEIFLNRKLLKSPNSYHPYATPWNEADHIPWSESSTRDRIAALQRGDSIEKKATYLQFSESTVRAKIQELGLKEGSK